MREGSRPRSICYIAPDVPLPYPSGASVHVSELATNLSRLGHPVHVIARRVRKDERPMEVTDGYTVHRVYRWLISPGPKPRDSNKDSEGAGLHRLYYFYLKTLFALYVSLVAGWIIRKNGLDVIIERETAFGAGGLTSLMLQRPIVLEIIGPRYSRLSVKRSSAIMYYTESMLREWVDRSKCQPIEAGVNTRLFFSDTNQRLRMRKALGFGGEEVVVGYVGSFQSWHGVDTLLSAVSAMRGREGTNPKLLFVGPSPMRYRTLAESLGLGSSSFFVGPVPYEEVPAYINACDIMVAPYEPDKDGLRREFGIGWPLKVLEYMACQKPVVTTQVPPIDKIVKEGETGLMVKPGDAAQLGEAILLLGKDKVLAEKIALNGLSLVVSKYSWAAVAAHLSGIVQEARIQ